MAPGYGASPYGQQAPNYGWNHNGGYPSGGFGNGMNHGGYGGYGGMGNGMMGSGMMGNGMMGGGMMGMGMQPVYVKQKSGSALTSIAGGALTGLAVYQLARAVGGGGYGGYGNHGYGGGHSTQHIYHHYDSPQENNRDSNGPYQNQNQAAPQTPQSPSQMPEQTSHTSGQSTQSTYGGVHSLANVPLAPFPSEAHANAENCTENCSTETNVAVTPVPEIDYEFPFSTIHPSLFPYASSSQNKELDFWARSINKKLNLNGPDTDNSETTASP